MRSVLALVLMAALTAACSSSSATAGTPDGGDSGGGGRIRPDAGCELPAGYDCCDGDQNGTYSCVDAVAVCEDGARLTPYAECVTPGPRDAGPPITCTMPAGFDCCDGAVEGQWGCDADGVIICQTGAQLTPTTDQCASVGPLNAGPDSPPADAAAD